MLSWLDNGMQLGWLIDPDEEKVSIYRPQSPVEVIEGFDQVLLGENVLVSFRLDLKILR